MSKTTTDEAMTADEANRQLDDAMTEADRAYWAEAEKQEKARG